MNVDVSPVTVVVADTSVLINFIHVRRLDLFSMLEHFTFVIPDQVAEEVTRPEQRDVLDDAFRQGHLSQAASTDLVEIGLYAELRKFLGRGESASLAMAATRGWMLACDEQGRFRQEALKRVGAKRLLNTPSLLLQAIRDSVLTVQQADAMKVLLETLRFRMAFKSFGDVL